MRAVQILIQAYGLCYAMVLYDGCDEPPSILIMRQYNATSLEMLPKFGYKPTIFIAITFLFVRRVYHTIEMPFVYPKREIENSIHLFRHAW